MGLRVSRNRRLSKILAKNNEVKGALANEKRRSNSTIGEALNELQVKLDSLKEVTKKQERVSTKTRDQTS
jgi:hypothetical protein